MQNRYFITENFVCTLFVITYLLKKFNTKCFIVILLNKVSIFGITSSYRHNNGMNLFNSAQR